MKTKNATDSLNEMILVLEEKNAHNLVLLREQFHEVYESLKPHNMVKSIFHDLTSSPEVKDNIIDNALTIGSGLLTKKIFVGGSQNPIRKILGTIAEFAVAGLVSKKSEGVKAIGSNLLKRFLNKV